MDLNGLTFWRTYEHFAFIALRKRQRFSKKKKSICCFGSFNASSGFSTLDHQGGVLRVMRQGNGGWVMAMAQCQVYWTGLFSSTVEDLMSFLCIIFSSFVLKFFPGFVLSILLLLLLLFWCHIWCTIYESWGAFLMVWLLANLVCDQIVLQIYSAHLLAAFLFAPIDVFLGFICTGGPGSNTCSDCAAKDLHRGVFFSFFLALFVFSFLLQI